MDEEAATTLRNDPTLEPYIAEYGTLTLDPATNLFRRLAISVLRQQVSTEAANAIQKRLFDAVEATPAGVLAADDETIQSAGLSAAKVQYINAVADAFQQKGYDRQYFTPMDDDTVIEELSTIRGIGPWTAKMFLLFGLGRADVFPIEDLGIRRGVELICDREMTRTEMHDRATEWAPYRSYASLYLWRAYEE